ncbi:MAG: (2Fe-2S) ferredoxin domain-containing protein [Candidatus Omnitrophica bacterium]|nr:(2Fe-2S) ferredoxin domain-containing protein [Candidatus Omnitrophota bacterium]
MKKKINSPEDLEKIREEEKLKIDLRQAGKDIQVAVHLGTCGIAAGARDILGELAAQIKQIKNKNISLRRTGCLGLCEWEPMLTIDDLSGRQVSYGKLDKDKVKRIVAEHILKGKPVSEYIVKEEKNNESAEKVS